jgi:hypothetical protein
LKHCWFAPLFIGTYYFVHLFISESFNPRYINAH